jgi:hypothetical protein
LVICPKKGLRRTRAEVVEMAMVTCLFRGVRRTEWKRRAVVFLGREEEKREWATCQVLSTSR